nr:hypothetical protein [Sedimentibacter sp.]
MSQLRTEAIRGSQPYNNAAMPIKIQTGGSFERLIPNTHGK